MIIFEGFVICFLIGSNWEQFALCCFVLIQARIGIDCELQLAFYLVQIIISSSKLVQFSNYA